MNILEYINKQIPKKQIYFLHNNVITEGILEGIILNPEPELRIRMSKHSISSVKISDNQLVEVFSTRKEVKEFLNMKFKDFLVK